MAVIDLEKLKQIAIKHGVELAEDICIEIAFPALEEVVAKSENKIDDVALASFEPLLKGTIKELFEKLKA